MSTRHHIALLALLCCGMAQAQVRIDAPVLLDGPDPAQRQVTGLPPSTEADAVLSTTVEQTGVLRFASPPAGANWAVELPALDGSPQPGTHLLIAVPEGATTQPALLLNGLGPYPIALPGGAPLEDDLTEPGTLLSLVFDGSTFQVMNGPVHRRRDCPTDMVAVTDSYCIDNTEGALLNYYDAAMACGMQGKRLCSWGEFHAACEDRVALGLTDMVDNWEWTNSTADSNFSVRVVGGGDCQVNQRIHAGQNTRRFHCCLTR